MAAPLVLAASFALLRRRLRRSGEAPSRGQLAAANALAAAVLGALAFAGFEGYYRFGYDATDAFGLGRATERWFARHYVRNAAGLRDDHDYSLRRTGRRRITFLGDSFTAGHGIADVEQRFVNRIRAAHPEWEVHLGARNGFDTPDQRVAVQQFLQGGYELDVVVLAYCLNDVTGVDPRRFEISDRIYARHRDLGWLLESSYFLNTQYYRHRARTDPDVGSFYGFVADDYSGPIWDAQRAELRALRAEVEQAGGRLIAVTFPLFQGLGAEYPFAHAHEALAAHWSEAGVPHLDLLEVYTDEPVEDLVVSRYDPHPNERAHALAAEAIAEFVEAAFAE